MKRQADISERETIPQNADSALPRPRRGRSLLGTLLAGVVALLLIAIVLAIVSKIGQLRLADFSAQRTAILLPKSHSSREALGLQAPAPLPEPIARPEIPEGLPENVPAPAAPPAPAELPPALQLPTAAASPPSAAPDQPARPPAPIWQKVAGLPYDRMYAAFLWRPTTTNAPAPAERPTATQDFARVRQASRISPEAARQLAEEHRPMQTLAQLRAQATMVHNPSATTQPSS